MLRVRGIGLMLWVQAVLCAGGGALSKSDNKAMADDDVVRVRRNTRTDHVVPVIRPTFLALTL